MMCRGDIQMTNERISEHKKHIHKKARRVRVPLRIFALFVVCALPFLLFRTAAASQQEAEIFLAVKSDSILQEEELPKFGITVETKGNTKAVLDARTGYKVSDLAKELEQGKHYTIGCEADAAVEGDYPVTLNLEDAVKGFLEKDWIGLVRIDTADGVLTVKNKVGEWDGDKFKRYDGTYVTNDFVVSKGNTYYFDEDGKKASGWQDISGSRYYFDKDGIMKTGWLDSDDGKYYLGADGKASIGWQDIDGASYYFGTDGKMATGEVWLGLTLCVFDQNGVLISKKESTIDPNKPMVALTFDDGPGPRTGELVEALARYNAHATFFMLGKKVPSYPSVIQRMKEVGCELGNHSYDHADLSKLDASGIQNEVGGTNGNLQNIVGQGATLMRPPYGAISSTMKGCVGMPMILWNIDTLDWKTRNAQATIDSVMGSVKDGDIILMHDIHTESVDAALALIPKLIDEGYQLVTVSEMARAKGIELKDGVSYTDF
ncbi:polysaccharide deacetylase family protein [[Clostridium] scindens]|nr:polysaccharide deacetylase family protein [[Clostridium] scindens]